MNNVNATDPVTGALLNHLFLHSYLSMVDQAGINTTLGLWGNNYIEANAGYLHGLQVGNRFGGTARLVFPFNTKVAFTVEGDMNETLVGPKNSGEAMVGMEFSNRLRPKELLAADHAVPVQVPRIRYEVITKKVRNGDDPPVANAGPNQINVAAGHDHAQRLGFLFSGRQPDHLPVGGNHRSAGDLLRAHQRGHDLYGGRRRDLSV